VSSEQAPAALGPYSQAIVAGGFVFCSGTAGIDPATGVAADGIEAQTEQALLNLAAVLAEAGASMNDVVKTTIFYADVEDFARLNEVYARHMPDPPPARSAPAHVRLPAVCSSRSSRSPSVRPPSGRTAAELSAEARTEGRAAPFRAKRWATRGASLVDASATVWSA